MGEFEPSVGLSIRVPAGFFDFDDAQIYPMAVMGRVFTYLAAYEHACDSFIFGVVEHQPAFVAKHRFKPTLNNDKQRRKFILAAIDEIECLSSLEDNSGAIDKAYVAKAMEMVWHHRTNLTHGRLLSARRNAKALDCTFERWSRDSQDRYRFNRSTYHYDLELMESILGHASYLRAMLLEAERLVSGVTA